MTYNYYNLSCQRLAFKRAPLIRDSYRSVSYVRPIRRNSMHAQLQAYRHLLRFTSCCMCIHVGNFCTFTFYRSCCCQQTCNACMWRAELNPGEQGRVSTPIDGMTRVLTYNHCASNVTILLECFQCRPCHYVCFVVIHSTHVQQCGSKIR